jgi:DNA-binding response OmpR family regulator
MPKILVIDDEVHIQKIIDYKLRTAGYTVIAAADGLEGLEKARAEQPDLILLDVMMPRMDGFQALEALKRDPATKAIPIFMLTVKGKEMDRLRGQQQGVAAYITKPFSPNALLARIEETLRPA